MLLTVTSNLIVIEWEITFGLHISFNAVFHCDVCNFRLDARWGHSRLCSKDKHCTFHENENVLIAQRIRLQQARYWSVGFHAVKSIKLIKRNKEVDWLFFDDSFAAAAWRASTATKFGWWRTATLTATTKCRSRAARECGRAAKWGRETTWWSIKASVRIIRSIWTRWWTQMSITW